MAAHVRASSAAGASRGLNPWFLSPLDPLVLVLRSYVTASVEMRLLLQATVPGMGFVVSEPLGPRPMSMTAESAHVVHELPMDSVAVHRMDYDWPSDQALAGLVRSRRAQMIAHLEARAHAKASCHCREHTWKLLRPWQHPPA